HEVVADLLGGGLVERAARRRARARAIARLDGDLVEVPVLLFLLRGEHVRIVEAPARGVRASDRFAVGAAHGDAAAIPGLEARFAAARDLPPLGFVANVAVVAERARLPAPRARELGLGRPRRFG